MKKKSKDLKKGEKIIVADQICEITSIEFSDIGKQGKRKARMELKTQRGERLVIIRPEDYPFDIS